MYVCTFPRLVAAYHSIVECMEGNLLMVAVQKTTWNTYDPYLGMYIKYEPNQLGPGEGGWLEKKKNNHKKCFVDLISRLTLKEFIVSESLRWLDLPREA